ncbi:hypothetical protein GJ744_000196 [Endocarpon pusillum]|uniref:AB hydrolase-1 domain-containing protein n=1 Tax=Endocarpon pusillum TaxID=364733 RepID=A0A8H7AWF5_9EURO|nr:hypothetical protein GJ744_000196 [Endocarpon pusillum]
MARVPVVGRLFWREYLALLGSLFLVFLEVPVRIITLLLPQPIIRFCYNRSKNLFNRLSSQDSIRARSERSSISRPIAHASDFTDLCALFGYRAEEHVVQTADGYLLGIHRLPYKKGEEQEGHLVNSGQRSITKPVVYLHHGLLMNSEVWVCITEEERCLPFVLAEQGYDVWLGNNRGNKYSKKSTRFSPSSADFWNFSMDQFAFHDIPDSIDYILDTTSQPSLSYIGFSQGTAQAFATLSIHPPLNEKVNLFIALAPAMAPAGLSNGIVDSLVKASPDVLFLTFGRKSLLSSATFWQSILYPPIFVRVIDIALSFLFSWSCRNITPHQKLAAYPHLYSFTSTKSVVHWFQIIRNKSFQMYDDDSSRAFSIGASDRYYKVAKFPTRNIKTPIVLVYGGSDSLVDIKAMLRELPKHTMAFEVKHFEHLDFLWAQDVDTLVFPHVLNALRYYSQNDTTSSNGIPRLPGLSFANANTARLRAGSWSASEDERSPSDFDWAMDSPTRTENRKSAACVARERQYISTTSNSPVGPDSPLVPAWEISNPLPRKAVVLSSHGHGHSRQKGDALGAAVPSNTVVTAAAAPPPLPPRMQKHTVESPRPNTSQSGSDSESRKPQWNDSLRSRKKTRDRAGSGSSRETASNSPGRVPLAAKFGNHGIRLGTSQPSVSVVGSGGMEVADEGK